MIQNFNNILTLESSMSFSTQSWNLEGISDVLLSSSCLGRNKSFETDYSDYFGNVDATHSKGRYTYCY